MRKALLCQFHNFFFWCCAPSMVQLVKISCSLIDFEFVCLSKKMISTYFLNNKDNWLWKLKNHQFEVPGFMSIHKIFFDKIKLILDPQVRNSKTQLTLLFIIQKLFFNMIRWNWELSKSYNWSEFFKKWSISQAN